MQFNDLVLSSFGSFPATFQARVGPPLEFASDRSKNLVNNYG
jgi:hypothetical protein